MKSTIHKLLKSDSNIVSKIFKGIKTTIAILALAISASSCSKNDDQPAAVKTSPAVVIPDNKLVLPAIFENNTVLTVPDAVQNTSACGSGTTPGTAENSITISKEGIIADENKITFEIDIADRYAGEVVVSIVNPAGNSISLIKRIGASDAIMCGNSKSFVAGNKLSFNAAFMQTIPLNGNRLDPIITGNYAPSRGLVGGFPTAVLDGNLANFLRFENIKGIWKIKIYDCGTGDICTLNSWKMKFDVGALL